MCSQVYHGETAAPLELFEQIALRIAKSNLGETTRRFSTLHRASGTPDAEEAADYLLQKLEEAGKLDNTLIVATGDHIPYFAPEAEVYRIHEPCGGRKPGDAFSPEDGIRRGPLWVHQKCDQSGGRGLL